MDKILTQRERDILKIIGRRYVGLALIASELFRRSESKPFDPEITVNNSIKRIIRKCKLNKLDWTLERNKVGNKLLIKKIKVEA